MAVTSGAIVTQGPHLVFCVDRYFSVRKETYLNCKTTFKMISVAFKSF